MMNPLNEAEFEEYLSRIADIKARRVCQVGFTPLSKPQKVRLLTEIIFILETKRKELLNG